MKSEGRRTNDEGIQNDEARRNCHKRVQSGKRMWASESRDGAFNSLATHSLTILRFWLSRVKISDFVVRPSGLCPLLVASAFAAAAHGAEPATIAKPLPPTITLEDFKLTGDLSGDQAAFTLSA